MIIVFGSNILDMYLPIDDLPGADQAIHIPMHTEEPGGKGQNQAIACARAGAEVRFFGAVGDGGHGRRLIKNMQNSGINTSGVSIEDDAPTGVAMIFVDKRDGTHRIVVSQGANGLARQDSISDELLNDQTVLLLQAELNMQEIDTLIRRARARHCKAVVMNLAPYKNLDAAMVKYLDILVMNEHEASDLADHLGFGGQDFEEIARAFKSEMGVTPVITLGEKGAIAYDGDKMYRVPALPIKAVDTVGAGDAFCGFLCAGLDRGQDFQEALRWGAVAGSLACTKLGAQAALPSRAEVEAYLAAPAKIVA